MNVLLKETETGVYVLKSMGPFGVSVLKQKLITNATFKAEGISYQVVQIGIKIF